MAILAFALQVIHPTFWHVCGRLAFVLTFSATTMQASMAVAVCGCLQYDSTEIHNDALAHDVSAVPHKSSIRIKLSFTKNHGLHVACHCSIWYKVICKSDRKMGRKSK